MLRIILKAIINILLFGAVFALYFWAWRNMKEEQPKGYIEEPSNELMDYD